MIRVFHTLLLGLVLSAVLNGLYWLATAELMPTSQSVAASLVLYLACGIALEGRRIKERRQLHDLYNLPSHKD